ncbi:methyl-accepting chemotaxis protein [Dechloromonas sp. HYN0024]|uniref:methyl-accepting chemotaxis protein n=1 Tax=Dechloromonas sp. HYN0024 TaxID=2231055 RepID=UPI000E4371E5|nr:PAS domain S-box protein [Dechloromonas sp. HYN0024]
MRTNLPITQKERLLRDDHLVVSKTDLKGRITYVNRDFLEISGFAEQELLGQSHNIVRHPDMPVEVFEDFWAALKAGRPWAGVVKNRCQNGDHYWAWSNIAPIIENGSVTGYLSVQRMPSRETVREHEETYRRFREHQQGNLVIRYGQVVGRGRSGLPSLGVAAKLWGGIGVIIIIGAIAMGSSWFGMQETQDRFGAYVNHDQALLDSFSEMYAQGLQSGQALRNIILDAQNKKAFENLEQARSDFQKQLEIARQLSAADAEVRQLLEQISGMRAEQADIHEKILAAVREGDGPVAQRLLNDKETPVWRAYKKLLLDGRKALGEKSARGRQEVQDQVLRASHLSLLAGVLAVLVGMLVAWLLARSIRRPIREMDTIFANILQGNYANAIDISRADEIGQTMQGLQILQTRMGFEVSETRRNAEEMTRIKNALDGAAMPMTICDDQNLVVYLNGAAQALWRDMAPQLADRSPGFAADRMVGRRIADLIDNDTGRTAFAAELAAPRTFEMEMAGKQLRVTSSPVYNATGAYLGRATQWLDRTAEVSVEREIERIVSGAVDGDFSQRLLIDGKQGFFLNLAAGLNQLLATASSGLAAVGEVLGALARGDLTQTMRGDYQGMFGQLKDDTNSTVARLREVLGQISEATQAINVAAKEIASGNQDLSARTEEQAGSLEETSSSMEELNSTVRQNAESAHQANELAKNSHAIARHSGEVVRQVVETMTDIRSSSRKIAEIISVIDGIAFQTNILALNAAVEAARAGEQGRGFAVVASEVRNLAQRSATAAKEIKRLIDESVDTVEVGCKLVDQSGRTMDEVVSSFEQVADLVIDIANASREQSSGIDHVARAISQIDDVTQQNAALVEQAAAAAESLEEQARGLAEAVGMFRLTDEASDRIRPLGHRVVAFPHKLTGPTHQAVTARPQIQVSDAGDWSEF